jgi:hypothetical protein
MTAGGAEDLLHRFSVYSGINKKPTELVDFLFFESREN